MKKTLILLLCIAVLSAVQAQKPKNVIYIIGDGMGTAQVYASVVAEKGDNSNFLRFPYCGFSRTYSHNKYTTDSGAGGSALMTGHKVDNYHIAVGPKGEWYPSVFAMAHEMGKSTGFVVTVSVVDATPATTFAHVPNRKQYEDIALQMSQCFHEVMIGCDQSRFIQEKRADKLAPLDTLKNRGYELAFNLKDMKRAKGDRLCALLSETEEPGDANQRGPILRYGVKKALDILSKNPNGFMLMVEGSQIDWACHNNDSPYLQRELSEFDEMLGIVLDWAKRDGNTLVVVTADHETGGLTMKDGNIEEGKNILDYSTDWHTGVMVPVFSYGPGAELFSGIQQNTDIANKIFKLIEK